MMLIISQIADDYCCAGETSLHFFCIYDYLTLRKLSFLFYQNKSTSSEFYTSSYFSRKFFMQSFRLLTKFASDFYFIARMCVICLEFGIFTESIVSG